MKFDNIPNSKLCSLIDEFVKGELDRALLKDRFINGFCYEVLAEKHCISVSTAIRKTTKWTKYLEMNIPKN